MDRKDSAFRKPDNFKSIQDEITRLALEKRKTPVIIIDEANYVRNAILNDLKILFNFEIDSKDRAVILLVGLSKDEGRMYISEKIKGAGGNPDIFEGNAVEAVLNVADGTPRMINKLCTAAYWSQRQSFMRLCGIRCKDYIFTSSPSAVPVSRTLLM